MTTAPALDTQARVILALALRKRKCGPWLRRAALVPAAYLLGELLVLGVNANLASFFRILFRNRRFLFVFVKVFLLF